MTLAAFWADVVDIWVDGGPLMYPLAGLTLIIYFGIFSLYLDLRSRQFNQVDDNLWRHWVDKAEEGKGELGEVIRYASANATSIEALRAAIDEVRRDYLPGFDSRAKFAMIMVSTAPLAGLLGTVTGMLKTFNGLALSTGESTTGLVAGGIAEALITTQTGLVVAIPGYVLLSRIKAMREGLNLFFIRLENAYVRKLHTRTQKH